MGDLGFSPREIEARLIASSIGPEIAWFNPLDFHDSMPTCPLRKIPFSTAGICWGKIFLNLDSTWLKNRICSFVRVSSYRVNLTKLKALQIKTDSTPVNCRLAKWPQRGPFLSVCLCLILMVQYSGLWGNKWMQHLLQNSTIPCMFGIPQV